MSLVPVEHLRGAINASTSYKPERLSQILDGAESWIRGEVRRQLTPLPALVPADPQTDPPTFTDTADPYVHRQVIKGSPYLRVPDARVITLVTVDGTEVTAGDYELLRHPFPVDGPVTHIELLPHVLAGRVAEVTGRFGFLELPAELHEAIVTLAARRVYEESIGYADTQEGNFGSRSYVKRVPTPVSMVINDFTVPDDKLGL